MNFKISVVVPIYNMERFILRAIECLKSQYVDNIEFILVNDGSKDKTLDIIHSNVIGDPRFRIISIENQGYGHACNIGIRTAKGDYVAIYEPDDVLTKDFYSTLSSVVQNVPCADVIRYNGFYRVDNKECFKIYSWDTKYTEQILDKYQMKRFWRSHPSVYNGLYRKEFLIAKKIYFCESPKASFQDATFMISLFYSNPSIYIVNSSKYYYTIHDGQSINNILSNIDNVIWCWNDEYKWIKENKMKDESFFLYRVCMQAHSICKKIKDKEAKNKIYYSLKFFFRARWMNCKIANFRHKCICYIVYMRIFLSKEVVK